jgi:3-oxoacyl-[acyl-carrier-protein] synthase-3
MAATLRRGERSIPPYHPIGSRILAFGGYQPDQVVTNDDLARRVDTNDEWIRSRVGIESRRVAGPEESVTDMATVAGGKALAASGLSPADIDLVVVATCSTILPMPSVAAVAASRLGIIAPGAYDLNAACAGFCYALAAVSDSLKAGSARNALVIGAEKMTDWLDWDDRSTCIIFADGAGAAVVAAVPDGVPADSAGPRGDERSLPPSTPGGFIGIGPVVWGSAGDQGNKIQVTGRTGAITQDGQGVFRWATSLHPVALQACERAGISPADLTAFIPHQANLRIIEALARKLGIPRERVADDIVHAGNTSSASVPLALSRMAEQGRLESGTPALLMGFGAGLSYAAQVITLP